MKTRTATLLAAAVMSAGLVTATVPAADAAPSKGCVTAPEFAKVKKGMTSAKVAKIFGTAGKREAYSAGYGYRYEIRGYKTCTPYGAVSLGFANGKLDTKSAVF